MKRIVVFLLAFALLVCMGAAQAQETNQTGEKVDIKLHTNFNRTDDAGTKIDVALLPAVCINEGANGEWPLGESGRWSGVFGAHDQTIWVTNDAESTDSVYVRAFFAFETDGGNNEHIRINPVQNDHWEVTLLDQQHAVNGVESVIYMAVYEHELVRGADTLSQMTIQLGMYGAADNAYMAKFGGGYTVQVLAQAVQTTGYTDAATALNDAFGEPDASFFAKNPWKMTADDSVATALVQ